MKKGISLVVLVITIVVLVILTGAVVITTMNTNMFGNTQSAVNDYNKKVIIEDVQTKIQTQRLSNVNQGIYKITVQEIIPIIEQHGTFDNNVLKLTTTQGIEIWLYEIMQIPLEEYATITYENSILTVQTELINNGYRVQYTTDAGSSWSLYNNPVTVSEESGIQIRLINEDGQVVSNTLKITGGVIGEVDNISPTITIEPNVIGLAKDTQVTITVTDNNELANNNTYEYYLSTSQDAQTGGSWITYTNGTAVTIGTNLTGTYYLHVKQIYDVAGNTSGNVVSQSYTFDNTEPYSFIPTIGEVTATTIQIKASTTDNNGQTVTYKYSKDNGATWQNSNTFIKLTANTTYNQIQVKAIDTLGNERISNTITATTTYPIDGTYYAVKGVNSPRLASGMTAVYWNGTTEVTSQNPGDDPNFDYNLWYDYKAQTTTTESGGTSKWANAKTSDGSYWVWIPRYAYSITSGYHTSTAGTIEVEFLKDKTNVSTTGRTTYQNASGANNWNIHPAFYYDGNSTTGIQLTGIWVAKYEMSMEENGSNINTSTEALGNRVTSSTIKAVSKPGKTAWRYINLSNAFINSLNYDTNNLSNVNLDSHLMKNSEWGAVAYLAHSKYGRNKTEITINGNSSFYTGGSSGATAHTNVLQSTTGNCYGIYDVSGGSWENIAAYLNGTATTDRYGAELVKAVNKYKDVYDTATTTDYGKISGVRSHGDAIYETSAITSGGNSWYGDISVFVNSSVAFFSRGGSYGFGHSEVLAGAFAFTYNTCVPHISYSWRVVLWNE